MSGVLVLALCLVVEGAQEILCSIKHSHIAGLYKCYFLYGRAAFDKIANDAER